MSNTNDAIEYVSMTLFIFARKMNGHTAGTLGVVIRFLSLRFLRLFFTQYTQSPFRNEIYTNAAVRSQQITVNGIWR